ncbi:MAG: hypothetical protein A2075_21305 [Geobacteraceae bacterium GWC2_58_44]|nr:MAG: hypothetical protein A2075_21305 [Geobacteraceae bacterium GWC2_58_44]HBG04590.1 hypothetical protein [Geobacter sp.]
MKLETDIKRIEELSQQRDDENWDFRCFLKRADLSVAKIDSIVHELYREVSAQIDCTLCGNCCKVMQPELTAGDAKKLASQHELATNDFQARFLHDNEDGKGFIFNAQPCPFLQNNRCSVYDNRPRDCRSYPHLHKRDFVFRMNQAYSNCSICPIVFNVYERLKQALWRTRRK